MSETGIIFDIQRFSVHDGPGIRTTVFIKGCPLSCAWCSNPESQSLEPQLIVRDIKCQGCGTCVAACPQKAIAINGSGMRKINWDLCNGCLDCVASCIYQSLNVAGKSINVSDVVNEGLKDKTFYARSGGGVTISGGEPLGQPEFVTSLARNLKEEGLHVALDTSGYAAPKKLSILLPYLDLVLYDIKHLDNDLHKQYTGVDNNVILSNLRSMAGRVKIWLRIPMIAGFNDLADHIDRIITLAREVDAEKVSFLPYHEGGASKCNQIGKTYPMPDAKAPHKDHVALLQSKVTEAGLKCGTGY
jgi:pyruvate formate lyase activating enzyme